MLSGPSVIRVLSITAVKRHLKLSLGRITLTKNIKRFGGILLAVELYTFDQFLGVFWSFFKKKTRGGVNYPRFRPNFLKLGVK